MRIAPHQPSGQPLGIGVDQELVRVETKAALGLVWTMDAVAVELARGHVVQIAVPDVLAALRQGNALELASALAVEQAELHLLGIGGKQRKIGPPAIPCGPEWVGSAGREPRVSGRGRE